MKIEIFLNLSNRQVVMLIKKVYNAIVEHFFTYNSDEDIICLFPFKIMLNNERMTVKVKQLVLKIVR